MQSIFDKQINRRNTGSAKWNVAEHELPMWVADMDFETAPEIAEAIRKRAEHGVYGYTVLGEEWYEAYQGWWQERHNFTIEKEWLLFCTGVIPAVSSIIRKMTTVGENIAVMTPVYNNFFNSILNNGRNVLESRLRYENGIYSIDFDDLEEKLADPQTSMLLLCNPHNPIGKIWDRKTLERIGELCIRHHVLVLADEIHCDLTKPGSGYIPFASISKACRDNSITCIAPTKAFNIAGIQTAAVFAADPVLRHRVNRGLNTDEVAGAEGFCAGGPGGARGGEPLAKSPPLAERCDTAVRQIELAARYNCEKVAVLTARRHYAWYLKGVPHGGYYKEQIVRMETLEDVYRVTKGIKRDLT